MTPGSNSGLPSKEEGQSTKEIAHILHTSIKTVEKQRRDALRMREPLHNFFCQAVAQKPAGHEMLAVASIGAKRGMRQINGRGTPDNR